MAQLSDHAREHLLEHMHTGRAGILVAQCMQQKIRRSCSRTLDLGADGRQQLCMVCIFV